MPKVLVTAALPYANGSIHLGHMLEAIQTDVYVRARKLAGDDVIFMWADDTHGTPIQLRARAEGVDPEAIIDAAHKEHKADYTDFGIGFDIFYTTHSDENRHHAGAIFKALEARGDIFAKEIEQMYSPEDKQFLPDRFIKGTCPKCGAKDQYGDSCEVCGSTYAPTDLIDPYSAISGAKPVLKKADHLFFDLGKHEEFLREWTKEGGPTRLQASVRNWLQSWLDDLKAWDISRDEPYFGIEIPGHPGKYFYVWFDAPIGYIAATQKYCDENGLNFDEYWKNPGGDTEIVHVIGKDIVYFHCLFWPAMLNAAGYTVPRQVNVHGWVQVNGEKMSKSRGTFINARKYLEFLPAYYLRYYFAAKLSSRNDDFDLSFEDFVNRVNADLVNKAANLPSRCVKLLHRLDGKVGAIPDDARPLMDKAKERLAQVPGLYRDFEFASAIRLGIEIAEDFNQYLSEREPWKTIKNDPEGARGVLSAGLWAAKVVCAILLPALPEWGAKAQAIFNLSDPLTFDNAADGLPEGHELGQYENLAERVQMKTIDALIEASKEEPASDEGAGGQFDYEVEPLADETAIDQFLPIDLRVGKVLECNKVPKAKKLLQLTIDLGPLGQRNILSGIALSYDPADLVGKHVAVYANLKPRKMKFGTSEGMILASGAADDAVTVLTLDPERSKPGERIS